MRARRGRPRPQDPTSSRGVPFDPCAATATRTTLVVGRAEDMEQITCGPGTVVVAVDGSDASVAGLRYARRLATRLDLRPVAVLATDERASWDWGYPWAGFDVVADAGKYLRQVLANVFPDDDEARAMDAFVLPGRAVRAICAFSRDAELLVLGRRRHHAVVSVVLGSVAAGCAAEARCPVLLVGGEATADDADRAAAAEAGHIPATVPPAPDPGHAPGHAPGQAPGHPVPAP